MEGRQGLRQRGIILHCPYRLERGFKKFLDKKNLASAGTLGTQIQGWMTEANTKAVSLHAKLPSLKNAKPADLEKVVSTFVL